MKQAIKNIYRKIIHKFVMFFEWTCLVLFGTAIGIFLGLISFVVTEKIAILIALSVMGFAVGLIFALVSRKRTDFIEITYRYLGFDSIKKRLRNKL